MTKKLSMYHFLIISKTLSIVYNTNHQHLLNIHHNIIFLLILAKKGERQYATASDTTLLLSPKETQWVHSVVGSFLYYCRAIDCTLSTPLNDIAITQAQPTLNTKKKCLRLMNYVATYPDAYICYRASDMILNVDSDAAHLVLPKAKSRIAGFSHLTDKVSNTKPPPRNGPLLVEGKTIKHVVTSAAEAETSSLFHNAKTAIPIRRILIHLSHPQPPTPIKVDNSTAAGFVNKNITQKKI